MHALTLSAELLIRLIKLSFHQHCSFQIIFYLFFRVVLIRSRNYLIFKALVPGYKLQSGDSCECPLLKVAKLSAAKSFLFSS